MGDHRGMAEWVFAFGSLVAEAAGGVPAVLEGWRREWGVAMDNRVGLPGYKRYRAPGRPGWPALHVAFLDVVEDADPDASVEGVCVPVDPAALALLDLRERNYARRDVTDRMQGAPEGRVWTYVGSRAGRARLAVGRARGSAVVARSYWDAVASFAPAPSGLPVVELERVALVTASSA